MSRGVYVPRVEIREKGQLKEFIKEPLDVALKAWDLVQGSEMMTPKVKRGLEKMGFVEDFIGFNSHSGDCFIYRRGDWYILSFGCANVANAGVGFQLDIEPTEALKKLI